MPSNLPDPRNIPDMSLDERGDKPAPPTSADPAASYQPRPLNDVKPVAPKLPGQRSEEAAPLDWQEGDRVLAPWEPMFLYAGTIKQIRIDDDKGDQALIEFDDGDAGWVFLYSLCEIEIKKGQRVFSRRHRGPDFHPGEIREVDGEEVRVTFDSGDSEWTTVAALRIPCIENGPGAVGTKFGSLRPDGVAAAPPSTGIPSWVWWVGFWILFALVRAGCRSMSQ